MEVPKTLYHGTFWAEGIVLRSGGLIVPGWYVSTTPDEFTARRAAIEKRYVQRESPGKLTLYIIDADSLPVGLRETCIRPGQLVKTESTLVREFQEELRADRIRMQDWRFKFIPWEVTRVVKEEYRPVEKCRYSFHSSW